MNKEKKTVLPSTIDRLFTKYEERVNILKPYSFGEYTKLVDVLDSEFELVNIITFGKYQKILDKKLPYSKKIPILPHQHNCMTDIMKGVSKEISKEMIQRTVDKLKRYSIKDWNKYYLEDIKVGEVVDDIENGLDKIEMSYFQYLQLLNKDEKESGH